MKYLLCLSFAVLIYTHSHNSLAQTESNISSPPTKPQIKSKAKEAQAAGSNLTPKSQTSESSEAPEISTAAQAPISPASLQTTNRILQEMKNSDPGSDRYLGIRVGSVQILSNLPGLETSQNKTLATTGADLNFRLYRNFYIEGIYTKSLNIIDPVRFSADPNRLLDDLFYETIDVGLKYRFLLDETKPSNYLGFRLLHHQTNNNFPNADPGGAILVNAYQGLSFGVEKGIPITDSLGINASLDMISIDNSTINSDFNLQTTGLGFVVRGEVFYKLRFLGLSWRTALAYWQSGMINEIAASDRALFERQNKVLTYRMISGSIAISN